MAEEKKDGEQEQVAAPTPLETLKVSFNTQVEWDLEAGVVKVTDRDGSRLYRKDSEDQKERDLAEFYLEMTKPVAPLAAMVAKEIGGKKFRVAKVDHQERVVEFEEVRD